MQFMECKKETQMIAELHIWLALFGLLISTGLELVGVICILTMARRQNFEHIFVSLNSNTRRVYSTSPAPWWERGRPLHQGTSNSLAGFCFS